MYMYYFLGFQVSGEYGNRQIVEDEKSVKCREAENKDRIKRYKDGQNIFLLGNLKINEPFLLYSLKLLMGM